MRSITCSTARAPLVRLRGFASGSATIPLAKGEAFPLTKMHFIEQYASNTNYKHTKKNHHTK
jgi:hypothetical protein